MESPRRESVLVDHFIVLLDDDQRSPWELAGYLREFNYTAGRADVVAATREGVLVAFEAKLDRWRDALQQAYRNRAFVHASYVLMPPSAAHKSAEYICEFDRYGVGLCTIQDGEIVILIAACDERPVLGWLTNKARRLLDLGNDETRGRGGRDLRIAWRNAD